VRNIRRTDLNLLVVLDALLDERSVTRAAARLALTQSTVSGLLARLRKVFDDPLFVRTQRGLLPTPRAQALAPLLRNWLAEASALVAGETFDPAAAALTFYLSANDYIQSALIVPLVGRLQADAPNLRLAVRPAQTANVAELLAGGELDLTLTTTMEINAFDLPSRPLYEERYVGVVRSGHPLETAGGVGLEEFCAYPHVLVSPSDGRFDGPTDEALAKVGRTRRVRLSMPGFLLLPEILQAGDLIAVVPERVLSGRMSGLRTFEPPVPIPGFTVVALWHPRMQKDPGHRWLRELLVATARQLQAA